MKRIILLLGGLVAVGACLAAMALYGRTTQPFQGYTGPEQFVEIASGSATPAIGRRLVEAGIIRDLTTFRAALWRTGSARRLQAGEYRFAGPMTPVAVIGKLARGETYERLVTFPEGLTISEMAGAFEAQGLGPAPAFIVSVKCWWGESAGSTAAAMPPWA